MSSLIERSRLNSVVTFYTDKDLLERQFAVPATELLLTLAHLGQLSPVLVVDDNNSLRGNGIDIDGVAHTIHLPIQMGKEGAVLQGLAESLTRYPNAKYFIQSDFDCDPFPTAARPMVRMLQKLRVPEGQPVMILGERQEALAKRGHMDSHRKQMFKLQQIFCEMMGYPQLTDPTTGLRVYNRPLAEIFLQQLRGRKFGIDVEQLVIAQLSGAIVLPFSVPRAHKRGDSTAVSKFTDSQESVMLHATELEGAGLGKVVEFFGDRELLPALIRAGLYPSESEGRLVVQGKK